jgi:hypothetical protein
MFDAAIGPRLEARSLRIRKVFSAAGTFDATFAVAFAAVRAGDSPSAMFPPSFAPDQGVSGIPYLSVFPARHRIRP